MAITFIADTETPINAASTVTVPVPAGIQDGDTLVLIISHGYPLTQAGTNPLWTMLFYLANQGSTYIFTRTALATDTNWSFSFTNAFAGTAWCGAYRGGWVQGVAGTISGHILTTVSVDKCALTTGVRIDAMMSRRDSAGACVHADPAWATRRAYIDGISGAANWELSVADRQVTGWTYANDNWTMTLPPGNTLYQHHQIVIWLVDTVQPVTLMYDVMAVTEDMQAWVYKGRTLSTDDTPEAP